ncbi:hypothetical protein FKW77_001106 [Venturia effusa]|uniref:GDS1 winged helix domain-containing protein n=1 Tax=Venturia effusa TaxID=50376 RepID=A0A517LI15_9PEZI|nr:hypothetical protein FKW77_001106 [Venturia effusa]
MPYNTRRKSVSLSSLGIHVPRSPKASAAQRSPPATTSLVSESQPPLKKLKRSHTLQESLNPSHQSVAPDYKHERPQARVFDTPPPSPGGESRHFKVEIEGINDDIVVAVIEQLESTGNRPHLLKELAAILSNHIPIVQSSANQPAIISSRLSTFMKRQWTAQSPCPIGKELIGTHPKRIFFYLSQQPHQPFPEPADTLAAQHRIISPSLTSAENEEEDDRNTRKRDEMSPSPEVELDSPLLDDTDSHLAHHSFPTLLAHAPSHERSKPLSHGRTSPPLERDEREFTQTASSLQQRRRSETKELEAKDIPAPTTEASEEPMIEADESEESAALRNKEAAEQLFGHADRHLTLPKAMYMESSPMLKPQLHLELTYQRHIEMRDVHHLTQEADLFCENVGLDELDDLFSSY